MATTAAGKGSFAETHPLALGRLRHVRHRRPPTPASARPIWSVVIGSKLSPSDTAWENRALLDPTRQTFVQIDIEPRNASWTFPAEHVLLGDAATVLDQLRRGGRLARAGRAGGGGGARVAAHRERLGYFDDRAYFADDKPILPQRVIGELQRSLPDDAIVTCDAGENRIMMTHFYQTKRAGGLSAGGRLRADGVRASRRRSAAKLVHPDRPVVAVCGDGGFAMTMNGLMTAIEQDIPIITVVFNNNALGWVLHGSGPFAAEFNDFDHAAIARAMGCRGVRVEDPAALAPALARGAGRPRPDGDRRAHLARRHLRRHHLAAGQGRLAAAALAAGRDRRAGTLRGSRRRPRRAI